MRPLLPLHRLITLLTLSEIGEASPAFLRQPNSSRWSYRIPSHAQNGTALARFNIATPDMTTLDTETLLSLDAPHLSNVTDSAFDWWYFDAVSETDPRDSFVVTFFTSSATAFPFLDPTESSILIAYLWASFANGTVFSDYVPATLATVAGGEDAKFPSAGKWASTGFNWLALDAELSEYQIIIASERMQVEGRVSLSSQAAPHLPCGIQSETTTLELAPHIGWACLKPDAVGSVDITIQGSRLQFQGPAYHDKNWSDRPFTESVQSWYWGHGRVGSYSIVWFSYLALNDPTNTTYVSSYVARDGEVLISACSSSLLTVRPVGKDESTGGRYPPRAGDIPVGFQLVFDLGEANGWLKVNVTAESVVAGDEEYYMRWTGSLTGEAVEGKIAQSSLDGVAVFEQFVLLE
ncbi:Hydroxyneurosporene synthase [Penicillium hispanicum]|uniref:Hydroxyneurosporene synthase n=1 Tax=Penicillium hispanicum TaxID=1080232 RepID=UPI002541465A|nr:Hydroxyneurosporene synthase [Penicillium hispanicum]KAJ5595592.1 Hydroxyneurosporene synthase [Penicillium hispanicum]